MQDTHIGPVLRCLEKGEWPDTNNSRSLPPHTRRLIQQWDQLVLKDEVMWGRFEDKEGTASILQLIPQTLREEVLTELHSGVVGGHLGEEKTMAQLRERFYWPGQ